MGISKFLRHLKNKTADKTDSIANSKEKIMAKKASKRITAAAYAAIVLLSSCALLCGVYDYIIPDSISVFSGSEKAESFLQNIPFAELDCDDIGDADADCVSASVYGGSGRIQKQTATVKLFSTIPLKKVEISKFDKIKLTPGGMPFGVKFYTDGVLVVGLSEIALSDGSKANPAADAGIKIKDAVIKIDGNEMTGVSDVTAAIENCGGNALLFTVRRGTGSEMKTLDIPVTPIYSESDGKYKTGLWVRSSAAGIGTVTFLNTANNSFAGLGHGICDIDTGMLLPLGSSTVTDVTVSGINRGKAGAPGEIQGFFSPGKTGTLLGNSEVGVSGVLAELPESLRGKEKNSALPIALKGEIKEGRAEILCTVTPENEIGRYEVTISKLDKNTELKNFVVTVTDPKLLELTGGIVQGMSGSPIIQDGKLIGAVTHVLINDPARGYGIFIENMLKNMPDVIS